jgi:hypothetical protein
MGGGGQVLRGGNPYRTKNERNVKCLPRTARFFISRTQPHDVKLQLIISKTIFRLRYIYTHQNTTQRANHLTHASKKLAGNKTPSTAPGSR